MNGRQGVHGVVSLAANLFHKFFLLVIKAMSFEVARERKNQIEPQRAQGCLFTKKQEFHTKRSPCLSSLSATLLPEEGGAGSRCINKGLLVTMEGRDQVLGSTHPEFLRKH